MVVISLDATVSQRQIKNSIWI